MKLKFNLLVFFGLITYASVALENNSDFSESKEVIRSFHISRTASVDISNKYGKVVFNNWDKDSVKIIVNIISEGSRLDKVQENLRSVNVRFMGNEQYVEAVSSFGSGMGIVKKSAKQIAQSLNGANRVKINFTIYLPKTCDVNIDNQFGDVYMTDIEGMLQAEVTHGNFRATNIKKIRRLKVRYGDIRIDACNNANIDIGFGDADLGDIKMLSLESTTASVLINSVETMDLISKNDHITIGKVERLTGTSTLSDLNLRQLNKSVDFNSKFGSIKMNKIEGDFQRINLTGSYTNYTIVVNPSINSNFKIELVNSKSFHYDQSVKVNSSETLDKSQTYNGTIGKGGEDKFYLLSKNGHVSIEP